MAKILFPGQSGMGCESIPKAAAASVLPGMKVLAALSVGLDLEQVPLCYSQASSTMCVFLLFSSSLGEGTSRALDLGLLLHSPHREQDALGIPWKHSIPRTSCGAGAVNDLLNVPFPFCKGAGFGCSSRPA